MNPVRKNGFGALGVMLLLGALMVQVALVSGASIFLRNNIFLNIRGSYTAFFTAKAGVEDGLLQLARNKNFYTTGGYTVVNDTATASVVVLKDQPLPYQDTITATSSFSTQIKRIQAIVNIDANGQISLISMKEI